MMFTYEEIAAAFEYDPETGVVKRKPYKRMWKSVPEPKRTTGSRRYYINFMYKGKSVFAHRIAWILTYGHWPKLEIDHIDGDGLNNRICNIRCVKKQDNQRNSSKRCDNKSGITGVIWSKRLNKWVAQIRINNKSRHLGVFESIEDAALARKKAETEYGFHPNHGRSA